MPFQPDPYKVRLRLQLNKVFDLSSLSTLYLEYTANFILNFTSEVTTSVNGD